MKRKMSDEDMLCYFSILTIVALCILVIIFGYAGERAFGHTYRYHHHYRHHHHYPKPAAKPNTIEDPPQKNLIDAMASIGGTYVGPVSPLPSVPSGVVTAWPLTTKVSHPEPVWPLAKSFVILLMGFAAYMLFRHFTWRKPWAQSGKF